jgi:hypothetical protein
MSPSYNYYTFTYEAANIQSIVNTINNIDIRILELKKKLDLRKKSQPTPVISHEMLDAIRKVNDLLGLLQECKDCLYRLNLTVTDLALYKNIPDGL